QRNQLHGRCCFPRRSPRCRILQSPAHGPALPQQEPAQAEGLQSCGKCDRPSKSPCRLHPSWFGERHKARRTMAGGLMIRTGLARAAWAVLALVLAAIIGLMVWEPFAATRKQAPPDEAYSAEIIRDDYGVPHIYGARDVDVAYGIARAHAEDDFFTLQDVLAMTRGRYGAIAGEAGAPVDYIYHLLGARPIAEREFETPPPDVRAILDAYASGLNDHAAAHPGELKLDRLFPVNGLDIATGFALRQPFFFQLDNVIGALAEDGELPREHGPPIPQSELALPL